MTTTTTCIVPHACGVFYIASHQVIDTHNFPHIADFDVALEAVKREDETTFLLTLEVLGPVALATAATSVPGGPPTTPPPQIDVAAAAPVPLMNTAPIYDTQVVMSGSQPMQYQQQPMQYRQHAPLPTFNHGFFQPPRFMCVRLDITQSFGWSMAGGQSLVVVAVQGQAAAAGVRAGWVVCRYVRSTSETTSLYHGCTTTHANLFSVSTTFPALTEAAWTRTTSS